MKNNEAHPLETFYEEGLQQLSMGLAEDFISKNKDSDCKKQRRILEHIKIKNLMAAGSYILCLAQIKRVRAEYGDHISLLCEQAVLYYLTSQFSLWQQAVFQIDEILPTIENHLSQASLAKTWLLQAKFYEEMGYVRYSLELLNRAEKHARNELFLRVRNNKLRLIALYPISNEFDQLYLETKQSVNAELGFNTHAETMHALILAECQRYSDLALNSALQRLKNLELAEQDTSLIIFDLCVLFIKKNNPLSKDLINKLYQVSPQNEFESNLKKLILHDKIQENTWLNLLEKMPLGNFLTLCPFIEQQLDKDEKETFHQFYDSVYKTLPRREQKNWERTSAIETIPWNLDLGNKKVKINDKEVSFSSRKTLFQFLELMSFHKDLSLEMVVKNLYDSEYNDTYFHRIRRLVKRINDEFETLAFPKVLSCDKENVRLLTPYR